MPVTTANTLNIPQPLVDRMEIIRISGYTENEKMNIASNTYFKTVTENGIKGKEIKFLIQLLSLIRHFTRESGVRSRKRVIKNNKKSSQDNSNEKKKSHFSF